MGCHLAFPEFLDKSRDIKAFIPAQRDPPLASFTLHGAVFADQIKDGVALERFSR